MKVSVITHFTKLSLTSTTRCFLAERNGVMKYVFLFLVLSLFSQISTAFNLKSFAAGFAEAEEKKRYQEEGRLNEYRLKKLRRENKRLQDEIDDLERKNKRLKREKKDDSRSRFKERREERRRSYR